MSDLKRELKGPQNIEEVSIEAINDQILVTIQGLESKGILERNTKIYTAMVQYLAETKLNCRRKGLLLFGQCGTGKSFAAKVITSFRDLHYYTCRDLEKKYEKSDTHFWEMMSERKDIVIDDLGTESTRNDFGSKFELFANAIDERHRLFEQYGTRTIITTNLSGEDIKARYTERIYSRICQMCECINSAGDDLRIV